MLYYVCFLFFYYAISLTYIYNIYFIWVYLHNVYSMPVDEPWHMEYMEFRTFSYCIYKWLLLILLAGSKQKRNVVEQHYTMKPSTLKMKCTMTHRSHLTRVYANTLSLSNCLNMSNLKLYLYQYVASIAVVWKPTGIFYKNYY